MVGLLVVLRGFHLWARASAHGIGQAPQRGEEIAVTRACRSDGSRVPRCTDGGQKRAAIMVNARLRAKLTAV